MKEITLVPNEAFTTQKFITVRLFYTEYENSVYATLDRLDGTIGRLFIFDVDVRRDITTSYEEAMSAGDVDAKEATDLINDFYRHWKKTNEAQERSHD